MHSDAIERGTACIVLNLMDRWGFPEELLQDKRVGYRDLVRDPD